MSKMNDTDPYAGIPKEIREGFTRQINSMFSVYTRGKSLYDVEKRTDVRFEDDNTTQAIPVKDGEATVITAP
jgi:hypothetical protein